MTNLIKMIEKYISIWYNIYIKIHKMLIKGRKL